MLVNVLDTVYQVSRDSHISLCLDDFHGYIFNGIKLQVSKKTWLRCNSFLHLLLKRRYKDINKN